MKKWMCLLLAGVLLLSITACKKPEMSGSAPTDTQTQTSEIPTGTQPRYDVFSESYQQVLNNGKKIRLQGYEEMFLDSYFSRFPESGEMDISVGQVTTPDGKQMLAIQRFEDTLVLYASNGVVYGKRYGFRNLYDLCTDGVYHWTYTNDQGLHYGASRLKFQNGEYVDEELYRIDQSDDGDAQYTIAGKAATQAEAQAYTDAMKMTEVTWYALEEVRKISSLYADFLAGKTTALENGKEKTLDSYLRSLHSEIGSWQYAFLDMNGDGAVELCVKHLELYIFTIKDGRVCHWYTDTNTYTMPLNNGALLMERHGAAPTHINYEYYTLDENGTKKFIIAFSWWDGKTVEEGKIYPDRYYVNEKEVTQEEYEEKVGKYLEIDRSKVVWYHREGETQKSIAHTYTLTPAQDAPNVKCLKVIDTATQKEIQTIRLEGKEWFITEPIYTDITFDGNKDILVPFQRAASGAYFEGYVWDENTGRYVCTPALSGIPNIALDAGNKQLLSHRTQSQITSYGMFRFDADKMDFACARSLYWESAENGVTVAESVYADGKKTEVNRFFATAAGGMFPDKTDARMAPYYEADSVWELDSNKWRNWVYTP